MKKYMVNPQIGKVKHSISWYDGIQKHKDGSDFYAINTFKNKKNLAIFEKSLINQGFTNKY